MPAPPWLRRQAAAERLSSKAKAAKLGTVFADALARRRKLFEQLRAAVDAGDAVRERRLRAEIDALAM